MTTKDPDVSAIGMLYRVRIDGYNGGRRADEFDLVEAVHDRDGGKSFKCDGKRWITISPDILWTVVDVKFCGGLDWYKIVSSKGEVGWIAESWRLEAVDGS